MGFQHPLLREAKRFHRLNSDLTPINHYYDPSTGLWCNLDTNEPWACSDDREEPSTKKNDIETGEDQKGH